MKWRPGPPPVDSYGLYLVVLDPAALRRRHAVAGAGYEGEPVCVRWADDRGTETVRQMRVDADMVVRHVAVSGVDRG